MSKKDFSKKHSAGLSPDPAIAGAILEKVKDGKISCAAAFAIAREVKGLPKEVGIAIDLMEFHITRCQLGLFGYTPEKKVITPLESVDPELTAAIEEKLADGRLSCKDAWEIASRMNLPKMTVSSACETLKIKVKPCQLGAF